MGHGISEALFFFPHSNKLLTEFNFIRFCEYFNIKRYTNADLKICKYLSSYENNMLKISH